MVKRDRNSLPPSRSTFFRGHITIILPSEVNQFRLAPMPADLHLLPFLQKIGITP